MPDSLRKVANGGLGGPPSSAASGPAGRLRWRRRRQLGAAYALTALALATAGCGSTSKSSGSAATSAPSATSGPVSPTTFPAATAQLCQARDRLKTSIAALNLGLLTKGASAIKSAVESVQTDLTNLKTAAGQGYGPQVDALQTSLQQLQAAVGKLGSGNSASNLLAVGTAIVSVGTSSTALFNAIKVSCGS